MGYVPYSKFMVFVCFFLFGLVGCGSHVVYVIGLLIMYVSFKTDDERIDISQLSFVFVKSNKSSLGAVLNFGHEMGICNCSVTLKLYVLLPCICGVPVLYSFL